MSLDIIGIVGPGGSSGSEGTDPNPPSGGTGETGSSSETGSSGQSTGAGSASSGGQTETSTAVAPTPVTASAAKVELNSEKPVDTKGFEYPISGPDRFARAVAEQMRVESQEQMVVEAIEEAQQVQDVVLDPEELRGAEKEDDVAPAKDVAEAETSEAPETQPSSEDSTETSVFVATPDDGNE